MKAVMLSAMLIAAASVGVNAQAAESSTKITFAKNSYCGNFAGNIKNGKLFRLWLSPDQNLVVRNVGDDQIRVAYVNGPKGRLDGDYYEDFSSFYTQHKGNHFIKVYGNTSYSNIEICAY